MQGEVADPVVDQAAQAAAQMEHPDIPVPNLQQPQLILVEVVVDKVIVQAGQAG